MWWPSLSLSLTSHVQTHRKTSKQHCLVPLFWCRVYAQSWWVWWALGKPNLRWLFLLNLYFFKNSYAELLFVTPRRGALPSLPSPHNIADLSVLFKNLDKMGKNRTWIKQTNYQDRRTEKKVLSPKSHVVVKRQKTYGISWVLYFLLWVALLYVILQI